MKFTFTTKNINVVEVFGKTTDSKTHVGTEDRELFKRAFLTEEEGFNSDKVLDIDDGDKTTAIQTVIEEELTLFVRVIGGKTSIAKWKLRGYTAASKAADKAIDLFIDEDDAAALEKLNKMVFVATAMTEAAPECGGIYRFETGDGTRVFVRLYTKNLTKTGWTN